MLLSVMLHAELIAACCVLHNVCELHGETFNDKWMEGVQERDYDCSSAGSNPAQAAESAAAIRNAFMSYFSQ